MHHGTRVTHVPWCMPGSLTSCFLWSWFWGKRSRHSWHMRNPQYHVSGKRPMHSSQSQPASPINASFSGSHLEHYTFMFVLLMRVMNVMLACVILGKMNYYHQIVVANKVNQRKKCMDNITLSVIPSYWCMHSHDPQGASNLRKLDLFNSLFIKSKHHSSAALHATDHIMLLTKGQKCGKRFHGTMSSRPADYTTGATKST